MQRLKELFDAYKKQVILMCIMVVLIILTLMSFIMINNKYDNNSKSNKNEIISLVEEKNNPLEKNDEISTLNIKIDIKGFVKNPGVYELSENSRVIDAIKASGGLESNAYTRYINLSKRLKDEDVIIINSIEEIQEIKKGENKKQICENTNNACIKDNEVITNNYNSNEITDIKINTNEELNTLVNINKASKEELMTLKGIGESKAILILEHREINGLFKSKEDLKNVKGIGEAIYEKIKDNIEV